MKRFLYASLLLALAACGSGETKSNHLINNDFETMDGWTGGEPNPSLNKEKAHSGVYSVKVDPKVEYSLGYSNTLSHFSNSRADASKMMLHGWAFVPSDKEGPQIVLEWNNPADGKNMQRDVVDLHNVASTKGYNQWIEFSQPVTLPPAATAFSQIKLYLWRGASAGGATYLDDLSLDKAQ